MTRNGVIDIDNDLLAKKLLDIKFMNHQTMLLLKANEYNGDALLIHVTKVETSLIKTAAINTVTGLIGPCHREHRHSDWPNRAASRKTHIQWLVQYGCVTEEQTR